MKKEIKSLLKETGVSYNDPLTSFLYELMRDHLPAGTVATIAMNCPRHTLTRYCSDETKHCTELMSYHDAMIPYDVVDEADRTLECQNKDDHVDSYPEKCTCGYTFVPEDNWQVFTDSQYTRTDNGQIVVWRDCEPGAMRFAPWLDDVYKPQLEHCLMVRCPGQHDWVVDSEASNCNRKAEMVAGAYPGRLQEDHHCWEIVGELR